jgi:integrase
LLHAKSRAGGAKKKPLGPQSLNHLRGFPLRTFTAAIKKRRLAGPNPVDDVETWKLRKRKEHDFLRPHEVIPVLRAVNPRHRNLFACAIYAGLRKGELAGLRKKDIDLHYSTITVRHSYDRDTTKGGHADTIPIAAELGPYLEDATSQSRSDLVFPGKRGKMRPPGEQLQMVLRRALRRAGICRGYLHKCRFRACRLVEVHEDAEPRRCPKHGHRMWPVGIVRDIRFHDLRHTTGAC